MAEDEHDLIAAVKQLADELGQTPTITQARHHIRNYQSRLSQSNFVGEHTRIIEAAGLAPNKVGKKQINQAFEKNIEQHLQNYNQGLPDPRELAAPELYPRTATVSDIHWPFVNQRVIDKFYRFIESHKPDHIIINGDAADMFSASRFPRSHNIFTPIDEEQQFKKMCSEFWAQAKTLCPKAKLRMRMGNHDIRPLKRVLESIPSIEHWAEKYFKELMTFDGVETIIDPREECLIGNTLWNHGWGGRLGQHRDTVGFNIVVSHTHLAGISYKRMNGRIIFEMNTGFAGDPYSKGLSYTPNKTMNWTPAFGVTDEDGPRIILC